MDDKLREKVRVTVIAPSLRVVGGQSIQAQRLIEAFRDDEDIDLEFLPNDPENAFQNIKILRTIFTSLKFWWLLLTRLRSRDIVHIFSSGTTSYLISTLPALFAAKLFGKKTILHYHTGDAENHLKHWKLSGATTMRLFDRIIVPSQFLVDVFSKFGLSAEVVFNFVDTEKFKFRKRKTLRPVFLSNRNFEAHYNVSCVIRAFAEIQKTFEDARLIVAGSGSEEEGLKKLVVDLELKHVTFVGRVPNEEMPKLYEEADIYLNSSIVDNMPLSLIEAFSAGLPVVSTNAGGIPYIVKNGETGLLVEANDCKSLANGAIKLLQNPDLAEKFIQNSRREVEKYSTESVVESWRNLFIENSRRKS